MECICNLPPQAIGGGGAEGALWRLKIAPVKTWQGCRWQISSLPSFSVGCHFLAFFTCVAVLSCCISSSMLRRYLDFFHSIAAFVGVIMLSIYRHS